MTTFNEMLTRPQIDLLPEWMREERDQYCEKFYKDLFASRNSSLWESIKSFFS